MPGTSISPLFSPGAGRSADLFFYNDWPVGTNPTVGTVRPGARQGNYSNGNTNWGLAGTDNAWETYKNTRVAKVRGGAYMYGQAFALACDQPPAIPYWPLGWMVIDWIPAWPSDLAGVESGIVIAPVQTMRPVTAAQPGIALYNDGGTLKFTSVGPGGSEVGVVIPWPAGGGPREFTWVRVELISATATAAATLSVKVNGQLALSRTWTVGHKLPLPITSVQNCFGVDLGQNSAVTYMYCAHLGIFIGPNAPGVTWP